MDTIQNILNIRSCKFAISKFNFQTWEEFEEAKKNKFVFLFGIGAGADFFFINYADNIIGIIDNDKEKQDLPIDLFVDKVSLEKCQIKNVLDISILKQYSDDEIVILIANLKSCEQIAEQLESIGISNYFSLLGMEAIKRANTFQDYIKKEVSKKVDPKKVIFYSMGGYSGHGKYIAEQLLKLRNDLDIVWVFNDLSNLRNSILNIPKGIRLAYLHSHKKFIHEIETAKIWVYDDMVPLNIHKTRVVLVYNYGHGKLNIL